MRKLRLDHIIVLVAVMQMALEAVFSYQGHPLSRQVSAPMLLLAIYFLFDRHMKRRLP
jgi:hypothetical protein